MGSWTNSSSTNETYTVSYEKTGLKGSSNYCYTFRSSNAAGNVWASPSWNFTTDLGSVFLSK